MRQERFLWFDVEDGIFSRQICQVTLSLFPKFSSSIGLSRASLYANAAERSRERDNLTVSELFLSRLHA